MSHRHVATYLAIAVLLASCSDPSPNPSSGPLPTSIAASPAPGATPSASFDPGEPEPSGVASADLINAAVAAGTIDDATGLMYRVFAVFEDPRLPPEFAAPWHEDAVALMRAGTELDSLPAGIADALRSYLVRPTDPRSVFHDVAAADPVAVGAGVHPVSFVIPAPYAMPPGPITAAAVVTCDSQTHWGFADGQQYLRVWGQCGNPASDAQILQAAAAADALYMAESTYLGGRKPNEDTGGELQGGSTRLDIYLTANCIHRDTGIPSAPTTHCLNGDHGLSPGSPEFVARGGVDTSSAFILINRSSLRDARRLRDVLAHELFHAFEYSYNTGGFKGTGGADWFLDACAMWAEWMFAQADFATGPVFGVFQGRKISLQDDSLVNGYLSFGWPLFMEQQGSGKVKAAWEAIVGKANPEQIMDAIDGVLPFDHNFRTFGMRGWNQEIPIGAPVTPWLPGQPVSLGGNRSKPFGPKSPATIDLEGTDKGAAPRTLPGDSPSLWAHYQHFKVKDDVGQVILDFSGVVPGARLDVDALVKLRDKAEWERRELPDGKTTWCIDNPKDDVEEFMVVLSNHAHKLGETLTGDWTVESPKEPCLSYHIRIDWTEIWNGVPDNVIFDGYADTIDPDAIGDVILLTGSGTYTGTRAGYIKCNPGFEGMPTAGGGTATFQAAIVGDRVTVAAFADMLSVFAGVNTRLFEGPRDGTYNRRDGAEEPIVLAGTDGSGSVCTHGYSGEATVEIKLKPPS